MLGLLGSGWDLSCMRHISPLLALPSALEHAAPVSRFPDDNRLEAGGEAQTRNICQRVLAYISARQKWAFQLFRVLPHLAAGPHPREL